MLEHTAYLFARPSFWEGMARVLDFGNTLSNYNTSPNGHTADLNAFRSDYAAIGSDFRRVLPELPACKNRISRRGFCDRVGEDELDQLLDFISELEPEEIEELFKNVEKAVERNCTELSASRKRSCRWPIPR